MKSWESIKWSIRWWMWKKSWIYIDIFDFKKCYQEWRRVNRYFRKPHWEYYGKWQSRPVIFRLEVKPLQWKTKYGEYRHEENPSITLSIFNKTWKWYLVPDKDKNGESIDLQYYETIMLLDDLLGEHRNVAEAVWKSIQENTWSRSIDDTDVKINAKCMLTRLGENMYDIHNEHIRIINEV